MPIVTPALLANEHARARVQCLRHVLSLVHNAAVEGHIRQQPPSPHNRPPYGRHSPESQAVPGNWFRLYRHIYRVSYIPITLCRALSRWSISGSRAGSRCSSSLQTNECCPSPELSCQTKACTAAVYATRAANQTPGKCSAHAHIIDSVAPHVRSKGLRGSIGRRMHMCSKWLCS